MDNFEEALNKAKDVAAAAYKKTEEVITIQKLKFDVVKLKNKLNDAYAALGKEIYNKKEVDLSDHQDVVEQIKFLKQEIKELKAQIRVATCKELCTVCGKEIDKDVTFCSHCGSKQER